MIAFKMKVADACRGITVQVYIIVELVNTYICEKCSEVRVIQRTKVEEPIGAHYTINDIRRLSGIDAIYCIYDAKCWDAYYGLISYHADELHKTDEMLKNDPVIQKDIADHKKDMKAFRIWQAANKWKV